MERVSKSENSGDLVGRDLSGRFLSGHKKLGGRCSGTINFNTKMIMALDRIEGIESHIDKKFFVENLIKKAIEGKSTKLIIYLWERVDGKPK